MAFWTDDLCKRKGGTMTGLVDFDTAFEAMCKGAYALKRGYTFRVYDGQIDVRDDAKSPWVRSSAQGDAHPGRKDWRIIPHTALADTPEFQELMAAIDAAMVNVEIGFTPKADRLREAKEKLLARVVK